ncbi:MAG TPA: ComEA family DNA-binding protein [Gaiellaceae bacterium]
MDALGPSRRRLLAALAAVLVVVLLVGRHLTRSSGAAPVPSHAALPADAAAGASTKLVVHVVGAVRRPGLYRLRHGARIADAVKRAGGTTRKANLEAINLAAPLEDGLQVVVPRVVPVVSAGAQAAPGEPPAAQGPVHLNTASLEQLDTLPGVGPVTAQKIVDWRQTHGAFTSVDDLDAIPGIGPARLEQLRDLVAP